jgi:hypothetical protein
MILPVDEKKSYMAKLDKTKKTHFISFKVSDKLECLPLSATSKVVEVAILNLFHTDHVAF